MIAYGFAARSTKARFGHYVAVNDRKGNPRLFTTKPEAEAARKEYMRLHREHDDNRYLVVEVEV